MRLDRLEISGFKSFSDRSELAFDGGVTAIVGPNGCGKSNVADALTWVLGEQSAKSLRGDKMEDVIFSGSDARKPTGAAEVTLRLSGVPLPARAEANGNGQGANGHLAGGGRRGRRDAGPRPGAGGPRRGGDPPALSLRRKRIPHRRRPLPAARRPRAADGHWPWRQGLLHHRAGQDRDDPQLPADRPAAADRGGRRGHQVQGRAAAPRS